MFSETVCGQVYLNKASETFTGTIPFKVYMLEKGNFSGTGDHTHDYMQIWYVMSGCCNHLINNTVNHLTKGNLFVLPPFVAHRIETTNCDDFKIIGCEFSTSFLNENLFQAEMGSSLFDFAYLEPFLVSHEEVKPRLQLSGKSQLKVEELYLDMLAEFNEKKKYYEINIKADLLKLLAIIAREYENNTDTSQNELFGKYRDSVNSAIRYINENYTSKIYIEDVCKIAMMSQTYFSYIFKQITGKTFVEYINGLRIAKAVELLEDTDRSITNICFEVGFNDGAYFNKVFKKEMGLSPRQFRKMK